MENLVTLIPMVLTIVQAVKGFIPEDKKKIVAPALALITGILSSYYVGGSDEVIRVLTEGLLAGIGAIGVYKIPSTVNKVVK